MGNKQSVVHCSSADPSIVFSPPSPQYQPSGPGGDGPLPPPSPVQVDPVNEKFKLNPGPHDELSKRCKDVFPVPFEGAKVVINKGLNQGFQVSHALTLANTVPSGYRFGATYVGTKMTTPSDPNVILMGDMDPSGNLNAQLVNSPNEHAKFKFAAQVLNSKFVTYQGIMDLRGKNWTSTFTLVNPNMFSSSGIAIASCLFGVTPQIALGGEVMYQKAAQIPDGSVTVMAACARYSYENSIVSGYAGSHAQGISYYYRLNEDVQLGLEIDNRPMQQQFIGTAGYQYDIPKANFTMRGSIDTDWNVTGVLEKRFAPIPFNFSLCGSINHVKNQFRLGCSLSLGG